MKQINHDTFLHHISVLIFLTSIILKENSVFFSQFISIFVNLVYDYDEEFAVWQILWHLLRLRGALRAKPEDGN